MMLNMQEGKTLAMMALRGGTFSGRYICFSLVAAAGADLEGVNLYHKSDVSINYLLRRCCHFLFFLFDKLDPSSLNSTVIFLLKLLGTYLFI